ncbi:hypothetical protein [uncultured Erythrobacter sp.]|uniref:hypothetical protein n=1 Tax=uncultured Erythrobacter sp. TaxID=263913 RepID=UPI0026221B96|nr:hypothetical protein [uncultured Erythrobacter sp.]
MPKFFIVDPSLRDERGHHFELSYRIGRLAARYGCEVHVLCNTAFCGQFSGLDAAIHPVFEFSNYEYADNEDDIRQDFALQLQDMLVKCGASSDDIVLCHTSDARIYDCALRYFEVHKASALPLHLATPYDEAVMPGNGPGNAVALTIGKLASVAAGCVFFWAETVPLANHLSARWNARVEPLLLPPKDEVTRASSKNSNDIIHLAYLGAAREEKGFHLLPDIVQRVLQDQRCDRACFFIQCSPQVVGYSPIVRAALDRLETLAGERVKLKKETLTSEDYDEIFFSSDGLLLLYDLEKYRHRGSGIAWDGATCGKVLITRQDTIAASFTTPKASVIAQDTEGWIEGIADLCLSPEKYQQAAQEQAAYLREISRQDLYLERLQSRREREVRSLQSPGAVVGKPMPLLASRLPEVT